MGEDCEQRGEEQEAWLGLVLIQTLFLGSLWNSVTDQISTIKISEAILSKPTEQWTSSGLKLALDSAQAQWPASFSTSQDSAVICVSEGGLENT